MIKKELSNDRLTSVILESNLACMKSRNYDTLASRKATSEWKQCFAQR